MIYDGSLRFLRPNQKTNRLRLETGRPFNNEVVSITHKRNSNYEMFLVGLLHLKKKEELGSISFSLKYHHHPPFFLFHFLTYLQENNGADPSIPPLPSSSYNTIFFVSRHIPHVRAKLTTNLSEIKCAITLMVENHDPLALYL
jgi:hypothetical protein